MICKISIDSSLEVQPSIPDYGRARLIYLTLLANCIDQFLAIVNKLLKLVIVSKFFRKVTTREETKIRTAVTQRITEGCARLKVRSHKLTILIRENLINKDHVIDLMYQRGWRPKALDTLLNICLANAWLEING